MSIASELLDLIAHHSGEYEQTLWTIFYNIPIKERGKLKKLLIQANEESKELVIDETGLEKLWDSFSISIISIK